jgi:aryl-alcohol dehydrogenase-like predicted oxidoreductase
MKYRQTGPDGVCFSEIGLGTYALAGVYGRKDEAEFERVVRRALELGITFFDSAPGYGKGEVLLGEALAGVRKSVIISTKVAASMERGFSCSFGSIIESCEESLSRLETDYIDLYQIHFDDGKTAVAEVIRAMEHLRDSGKILHYGIGHVSYERAGEYLSQGKVLTLMGELSAASRKYHLKMLPLVRRYRVGYIGFSLTGRGVLTGDVAGRDRFEPEDIRNMDALFTGARLQSAARIRETFAEAGARLGATAAQLAIRWALAQEGVAAGLVGPSTVEHLEEDTAAGDLEIPQDLLAGLDRFVGSDETRLAGELREEITTAVRKKVRSTGEAPRLIYVIEGLADLELAPEAELVACFKQLLAVMHGEGDVSALEGLRSRLMEYVER